VRRSRNKKKRYLDRDGQNILVHVFRLNTHYQGLDPYADLSHERNNRDVDLECLRLLLDLRQNEASFCVRRLCLSLCQNSDDLLEIGCVCFQDQMLMLENKPIKPIIKQKKQINKISYF